MPPLAGSEFPMDNQQVAEKPMVQDEITLMLSGARLQLLEKACEMRRSGQTQRANWLVLMANRLRETMEEVNRRLQG
jgi:hypothetical protein